MLPPPADSSKFCLTGAERYSALCCAPVIQEVATAHYAPSAGAEPRTAAAREVRINERLDKMSAGVVLWVAEREHPDEPGMMDQEPDKLLESHDGGARGLRKVAAQLLRAEGAVRPVQ